MLVLFHTNGNPFKNVFGNDSRDGVRNYNLLVCILADISAVGKNTSKRVFVKTVTLRGADTPRVQILDDVGDGLTTCVSAKYFDYKRSFLGVYLIMVFLVYHISKRNIATVKAALNTDQASE